MVGEEQMIQWNKGEPPKDGGWYIATMRHKADCTESQWICDVRWDTRSGWVETRDGGHDDHIGDDTVIIAWSEYNFPEDQP